eukprot:SM000206S06255  [mRNA]  locus=s206:51062:52597:- [translate_table: standard]
MTEAAAPPPAAEEAPPPRIGVLAIQGSFREHLAALRRCGVAAAEVRRPADLAGLAALIIPGGESTTMANVAERSGLTPELRRFRESGRPVWGTCAGLILLAARATGQKEGGQALLGGLDVTVSRNFFGSQINSFETELPALQALAEQGSSEPFRAIFIRAPAVTSMGPSVEVLAEVELPEDFVRLEADTKDPEGQSCSRVAVAVRQGDLLATAFHPELTADLRWHKLFIGMVREHQQRQQAAEDEAATRSREEEQQATVVEVDGAARILRPVSVPADLPIFEGAEHLRLMSS